LPASDRGNVGDATVLLYLVVTLTIQRFVLLNRVARLEAGHPARRAPAGSPWRLIRAA
jgi:hypothetical protein